MAVTPDVIAVALGRPAPTGQQLAQWTYWADEAQRIIHARAVRLGVGPASLDGDALDSVVVRAVVAMIRNPDDATQVSVSVDDGNMARTYRSSEGEISIKDRWWDELGLLDAQDAEAYSVRASFEPDTALGFDGFGSPIWWP